LGWNGRGGVAASLLEGGNQSILGVLGGGQQGPFWHRADDINCSACCHLPTTSQSTGDRVGVGVNFQGIA